MLVSRLSPQSKESLRLFLKMLVWSRAPGSLARHGKNDGGGTRSLCAPPPSFWGKPYPLFLSKQPQRFAAQGIAQCLIGEGALFPAAQTLGKVMHWVGAGVDDAVFEDMVGRIREFVGLGTSLICTYRSGHR